MTCDCGNQHAYQKHIVFNKDGMFEVCDRCANLASSDCAVPDVYLAYPGQKFENLCDEMGNPIEIRSKRHKKEVMDKLDVREAGDRINGTPFGSKSWIDGTREHRRQQFEKERPKLRAIYKQYLDNVRKKQ